MGFHSLTLIISCSRVMHVAMSRVTDSLVPRSLSICGQHALSVLTAL